MEKLITLHYPQKCDWIASLLCFAIPTDFCLKFKLWNHKLYPSLSRWFLLWTFFSQFCFDVSLKNIPLEAVVQSIQNVHETIYKRFCFCSANGSDKLELKQNFIFVRWFYPIGYQIFFICKQYRIWKIFSNILFFLSFLNLSSPQLRPPDVELIFRKHRQKIVE